MEMCRVCLSTKDDKVPLDENFITNYNLLTNLSITLFDGMPQYSCQTCVDTVQYFKEFRDKSITSETTLKEIFCNNLKQENKTHDEDIDNICDDMSIKSEVKDEIYDSAVEHFDAFGVLDDLNEILKSQKDIKPRTLKNRNKYKSNVNNSRKPAYDDKNWLCGLCALSFDKKKDLNQHLEDHKDSRQCNLCWEKVNSLSQLLAHRLAHVPAKQHKCHICDKKFSTTMYLEFHYRNFHIEEDEKKLTCNQCALKYDTPRKLRNHLSQVHSHIKFICDICHKCFRNKSNLKSHIRFHSENKSYVCDQCVFSCKHPSGLTDHKLRKHSPKRVYCKNCGRPFLNQEHHDRHKCKIKTAICPVCGQQLTGNIRLSKHMAKHMDVLRYECNRCPAKYKTKQALVAHLDRHDGNRTKQCEFCDAKFYTTTVLIKHRRIHTGEKPYVCKICNKGFTGNNNLKVHMRVHGEYLIKKKNADSEETQKFDC